MEGYVTSSFNATVGDYPSSQTEVLVQDTYPAIGGNQVPKRMYIICGGVTPPLN